MRAVQLDNGVSVTLGAVLARAGEGTIYEVVGRSDWVAKVFHPDLHDLPGKLDKVAAMIASPPEGAVQSDGFVVLTWPLQMSEDAAGYVMPRIDTAGAVEIHTVSNPSNRMHPLPAAPQWTQHATWLHLVNVAANLCLAVDTVHLVDAVVGDFQERNILVHDTTRVTLVDCDSMQFTDAGGHQFLCGVGRPEFTAPELAGVDLKIVARKRPSDLFALAVHIHLLLMSGNHPFLRGDWTGGGEQPDALTLAKSGEWAGGPGSRLRSHPLAPPITFLPPAIHSLFIRAFTDGARDPGARPSAAEWRRALLDIQVTSCPRGHQIPVEADPCPWCVIDQERIQHRAQRAQAIRSVPTSQAVMEIRAPVTDWPVPARQPAAAHARDGRWMWAGIGAVVALLVGVGVFALASVITSKQEVSTYRANPSIPQTYSPSSSEPSPTTVEPIAPEQVMPGLVTYTVTGTKAPFDQITITYVDASGQRRTLRNAYIPWSVTVTPISLSEVGSVEATSMLRLSKLNCSITRSDGTVLSSNSNDAPAASCG